ncbi:MAG: LysE family transporter [Desulfosarcina sp.]|nr:LysE family transporter [Desulfobacterales bacterium]
MDMDPQTLNTSTVLLSVAAIWALAVVTPGPNFFLTAQAAVGRSRPAALWSGLGTTCGTVLWGLSGFFGIALLFRSAPWLYGVLKLLGGAYLIYLGLKLVRQSFGTPVAPFHFKGTPLTALSAWRAGFLTNLSNPKTAAFVTSLFAASMPAATPLWLGLTSVALMASLSLAWYTAVACLFSTEHFTALYQRGRRWVDRSAGLIFITFGAGLAADQ